ncbi:MAG: hypothetical protein Q9187_007419 [Circinaria calcarea]
MSDSRGGAASGRGRSSGHAGSSRGSRGSSRGGRGFSRRRGNPPRGGRDARGGGNAQGGDLHPGSVTEASSSGYAPAPPQTMIGLSGDQVLEFARILCGQATLPPPPAPPAPQAQAELRMRGCAGSSPAPEPSSSSNLAAPVLSGEQYAFLEMARMLQQQTARASAAAPLPSLREMDIVVEAITTRVDQIDVLVHAIVHRVVHGITHHIVHGITHHIIHGITHHIVRGIAHRAAHGITQGIVLGLLGDGPDLLLDTLLELIEIALQDFDHDRQNVWHIYLIDQSFLVVNGPLAAPESASNNQSDASNQSRRLLASTRLLSGIQQATSLNQRWEQAYLQLSATLQDGDPALIALLARVDREALIYGAVVEEFAAAHGRLCNATEETVDGVVRSVESRFITLLGSHRAWRANSDAVLRSFFPQLEQLIGRDNSLNAIMEGS